MISGVLLTKISLGVCLVSLIFQVLGITCPGWLLVTIDLSVVDLLSGTSLVSLGGEVETKSSVWYVRVCLNAATGRDCTSFTPHDSRHMGLKLTTALTELVHLDWTEVKIELTTALVFCMTGILVVIIMICDSSTVARRVLTGMSSGCMLLSGVLILPAVIKVGLSVHDTKDILSTSGQVNDLVHIQTSWALVLSTIGLVIAFVSSALLIVATCLHREVSCVVTPHQITQLPPFNIRVNKYPFAVANITESDMDGHLPPKLPNGTSTLPRIGTKDDEPLAFQNVALSREDTMFDPFVRFPNTDGEHINNEDVINEGDEGMEYVDVINEKDIPGKIEDLKMV